MSNPLLRLPSVVLPKRAKSFIGRSLRRIPGGQRILDWHRAGITDVSFSSVPKSGNTWLRLMIGKALQLHFGLPESVNVVEPESFAALDARIPKLTRVDLGGDFYDKPEDLPMSREQLRDAKVILLVRDPRDITVSSFHHRSKRDLMGKWDGTRYEKSLHDYVYEAQGSFETVVRFYEIWAENLDVPKEVFIVRYEDMQEDAWRELGRVLGFLGLRDVKNSTIATAVEFAMFSNMKSLEQSGKLEDQEMKPGDDAEPDSFKVRRGKVGGYRDEMSAEDIVFVNERMRGFPEIYGYNC